MSKTRKKNNNRNLKLSKLNKKNKNIRDKTRKQTKKKTKKNRAKKLKTKLRYKKYKSRGGVRPEERGVISKRFNFGSIIKSVRGDERTDINKLNQYRGVTDYSSQLSGIEKEIKDNYDQNKLEISEYTNWINERVTEALSTKISKDLQSMQLLDMDRYFKICSNDLYCKKTKHMFNFNFKSTTSHPDNYRLLISQMSIILSHFYNQNKDKLSLQPIEKYSSANKNDKVYNTKSVIYFVSHSDYSDDLDKFVYDTSREGKDNPKFEQAYAKFINLKTVLSNNNDQNTDSEKELQESLQNFLEIDNQHFFNIKNKYERHTKYLYDRNPDNPKVLTRTLITESKNEQQEEIDITREHVIKGLSDTSYSQSTDCFAKTISDLEEYKLKKKTTVKEIYNKAGLSKKDVKKLLSLEMKTIADIKENLDKIDNLFGVEAPDTGLKIPYIKKVSDRLREAIEYNESFTSNLGQIKTKNINDCLIPYCKSKILDLIIIKIKEFNNQVFDKLKSLDDLKIKCDGKESSYSQEIDQTTINSLNEYVKLYRFLKELKISSDKYKQISKVALSFLPLIILRILQAENTVMVCIVNKEFLTLLYHFFKDTDDDVNVKFLNHGSYLKLEKIRGYDKEDLQRFTPIQQNEYQSTFIEHNKRLARINLDIIKHDKMRVTLYENQFNFLENDTSNIMTDTNDFFYRWRVNDNPIIIPIYHLKKRDVTEVTDINFRLRFSSILNDNYLLDRKPKYTRASKNNFTILLEELFVESKLNEYGINFYLTDTDIVPYQNINLLERINDYSKQFDTKNNNDNNDNDDEGNDIDLSGANRFMEIVFLICHKFESLPMARKLLKRDEYYDFFTNLLSSNISGSTGKGLSIKKLANLIQSASKNSAILPRFDIDIEEMRKRLKHFVKDYSYDLDSTDIEVGEYRVNINLKPNFFGTDKRWLDVSSPDTKTEGEMSSKIKQRIVDDKDLNSLYLIYMGFKLSNL